VALATECSDVRRDYGLRSSDSDPVERGFDAAGFVPVAPEAAGAGDVLLVRAGPAQLHVVILIDGGYIHADARLRRVVEVPGGVPWPALSAWRHPEHEDGVQSGLAGRL
jgi:hypothetical protein